MHTSRIPAYDQANSDGMLLWFSEMAVRDLLFHPEDSPENIVLIADGSKAFTDVECKEISRVLTSMFAEHGDDVINACYPIFMRKAGLLRALDS